MIHFCRIEVRCTLEDFDSDATPRAIKTPSPLGSSEFIRVFFSTIKERPRNSKGSGGSSGILSLPQYVSISSCDWFERNNSKQLSSNAIHYAVFTIPAPFSFPSSFPLECPGTFLLIFRSIGLHFARRRRLHLSQRAIRGTPINSPTSTAESICRGFIYSTGTSFPETSVRWLLPG